MARARSRAVESIDGVPGPLVDPTPEFWADDRAVEQLALEAGIDPAGVLADPDATLPWERFKLFRVSWASRHEVADLRAVGVYVGRDIHAGFPNTRRARLFQALKQR